MFARRVPIKIIEHCLYQAEHNLGKRGIYDGNQRKQMIGRICQNWVNFFLTGNLEYDKPVPDKGVDIKFFKLSIDVKASEQKYEIIKPTYNMMINGLQKQNKTDIYLFTTYYSPKQIVTVCGWIYKNEFYQKAKYIPPNTYLPSRKITVIVPSYEIIFNQLNDCQDETDLYNQLINENEKL